MLYQIIISEEAAKQLRNLPSRDRKTIKAALAQQLKDQPALQTRNRKPMRPNRLAAWELRVGKLRVYYDLETEPEHVVRVQAIGNKLRDRVYIDGREVEL